MVGAQAICRIWRFLARAREMPNALPGDLLAVCTTGAYGFVASSNYNSRPRPPEILVEGDRYVITNREQYDDLIRGEYVVHARAVPKPGRY